MRKSTSILASVATLALLSLYGDVACDSADGPPATPAADAAAEASSDPVIIVGVSLALTGNGAPFGQAAQGGIKVAETLVNSLGGVLGRQVRFTIVDDATDATQAARNLQQLVDGRAALLIGPSTSPLAAGLQDLAAQKAIALVSPSASTPDTRDREPRGERYFFRTAASHALQAKALALRTVRGFTAATAGDAGTEAGADAGSEPPRLSCRRPAVIYSNDAYGAPIAQRFATERLALGDAVSVSVPVPSTVKANYDTEVASVLASSADCQVIITFPDVGVGYLRAFRKATATDTSREWSTFVTVGSNGLAPATFLVLGRDNQADPASPTVGEGMFVLNLDLTPETPQFTEFKNLYVLNYPLAPGKTKLDGYTANGFDAAILACLAIQKAGSADARATIRDALYSVSSPPGTAFSPAKVADALAAIKAGQEVDYDGASGPVDFDEFGEVLAGYVVSRVKSGSFVPQPADAIKVDDLR